MAKHVDLNVQEDIVASVIAQSSVIAGADDQSIEVYPIVDGVSIVETPDSIEAWVISGLPSGAYNGTYIYDADLTTSSGYEKVFYYDAGGMSGAVLYNYVDATSGSRYWKIAYSYNKDINGMVVYTASSTDSDIQPDTASWTDSSNNAVSPTFEHTPGTKASPATGLKYDPTAGSWLYSDGSGWAVISGTSSNLKQISLQITNSDLDASGAYTLAHGSGTYIYDLECDPEPKVVTYGQDEAILDYSDRPSSGFSGKIKYLKAVRAGSSANVPDIETSIAPGTTTETMVVSPIIDMLGSFQHMLLAIVDDTATGWNRVWYGCRDASNKRIEVTLRAMYDSTLAAYQWQLDVVYPLSDTLVRIVRFVLAGQGDPNGSGYTTKDPNNSVTLGMIGAYQVCTLSYYNNQKVSG